MKKLFILHNLNVASEYLQKNNVDEVIFVNTSHSSKQNHFLQKRFEELCKNITFECKIHASSTNEIQQHVGNSTEIIVSAWDSHNEKMLFKNLNCKISFLKQNRLNSYFDMSKIKSFSQFRNKIEKTLPELTYESCYQLKDHELDRHLDSYFSETRRPSTYFETRNQLIGEQFATAMSKYLSCGSLNVKHLFNRVRNYETIYGSNKSTYWIIFELLWREFFYHSYQRYKTLYFSKDGINQLKNFIAFDYNEAALLEKIEVHSLMNCAVKELITTGHLSNRARQLLASYIINDLEIDWRIGALFFERHLLDYDVYSNYGNWQYLAGIGHDPRGQRYFDIDKQIIRYDPENSYYNYWSKVTDP